MPLEVECHTVPHLKALTRGIEHRGGHGQANIFRGQKISLKSTHFTSDQTAVSFDRICTVFCTPCTIFWQKYQALGVCSSCITSHLEPNKGRHIISLFITF